MRTCEWGEGHWIVPPVQKVIFHPDVVFKHCEKNNKLNLNFISMKVTSMSVFSKYIYKNTIERTAHKQQRDAIRCNNLVGWHTPHSF